MKDAKGKRQKRSGELQSAAGSADRVAYFEAGSCFEASSENANGENASGEKASGGKANSEKM